MPWVKDAECRGCGLCTRICPVGAIRMDGRIAVIDQSACVQCGACIEQCPPHAIHHSSERS